MYYEGLFRKMLSHQSALLLPPAFDHAQQEAVANCCNQNTRDGSNPLCTSCDSALTVWARDMYDWARNETRIVGLVPWYYAAWWGPGFSAMPQLLQTFKAIGTEIVSGNLGDLPPL